jgi:hypothetical protein
MREPITKSRAIIKFALLNKIRIAFILAKNPKNGGRPPKDITLIIKAILIKLFK